MAIFDFFKKTVVLYSPFEGKTINIEEVNDEVFSQKALGDGIAIIPKEPVHQVCALADAKIIKVFKNKHAISMRTNKLDFFLHFGIETVYLKGMGFEVLVKKDQKVKRGEPLIKLDYEFLKEQNVNLITPIIFSNQEVIKDFECSYKENIKSDIIMKIKLY